MKIQLNLKSNLFSNGSKRENLNKIIKKTRIDKN